MSEPQFNPQPSTLNPPPSPLAGRRIVVTRAKAQAGELLAQLRALGAEPLACPAIALAPPLDYGPLDQALDRLATYDWLILTSVNGVEALFNRLAELGRDSASLRQLQLGAIGPATAEALAAHGFRLDFVPTAYVAEAIVAEIGDVSGRRILLPRADIARPALALGLRAKGAEVDEVKAYRTVPGGGAGELAQRLRAGTVDAVTFTSSSTVRYLLDGLAATGLALDEARRLLNRVAVICIGPITAGTAAELGLRVAAMAPEYTTAGLLDTLIQYFRHEA